MVKVGDINSMGQRLVARTAMRGNHRFARVWKLECTEPDCGTVYGANSCDFHIRRCPDHGGKPGLPLEEGNA